MKAYPPGYWTAVFHKAAINLLSKKPISAEEAYWMARNEVDALLSQPVLDFSEK